MYFFRYKGSIATYYLYDGVMFISALELFKIGIGPSSSHTMGPMDAAQDFITRIQKNPIKEGCSIRCTLKDSLAYTGKGHSSDCAVTLGLHGYQAKDLLKIDPNELIKQLWGKSSITLGGKSVAFHPKTDIIFDTKDTLKQHPNGMVFEYLNADQKILCQQTYFSIGGGFILPLEEINQLQAPLIGKPTTKHPYAFDSADQMLEMSTTSNLSITQMKRVNEAQYQSQQSLDNGLDKIWQAMKICIHRGLKAEGILPGGLNTPRRAKNLYQQLRHSKDNDANDWLCAYAMAVNEENAAGHMVVTAPTNGAAGIIPAVLYYLVEHQKINAQQVRDFLLTASAIGGLIKHNSSISGAEVGCQGEVGSASSMAAAGMCAVKSGSSAQIENAAEIALEHHLGLTCDPIKGLVQIPCIERNGFGAISAHLAASIALKEDGQHIVSLDKCIETMKKTGFDMSKKYKETSLGGLALSMTEC